MEAVVTLSGVIDVEGTGREAVEKALLNWGIPEDSIDRPFVTIHHRASNKYKPVGEDEVIGDLGKDDLIRIILPLKCAGT